MLIFGALPPEPSETESLDLKDDGNCTADMNSLALREKGEKGSQRLWFWHYEALHGDCMH